MNKFYSEEIFVKYSEMDHDLALKPYSLLNFLQDIASANAEELGFGYSYMYPKNYAWFLIKYRMEFDKYPVDVRNLTLKTRPRGYNKLFAYREFELWERETRLGRIFSCWSVVDFKSRMTVPVSTAIPDNKFMLPFEKQENDLAFAKVRLGEEVFVQKDFEVRYNDIDVNGHANNGNYIIWAMEPLDVEFKTNHKIKTLDMIFKKEAKIGEKITTIIYKKDEKVTVHQIVNNIGEDLCLIEVQWI